MLILLGNVTCILAYNFSNIKDDSLNKRTFGISDSIVDESAGHVKIINDKIFYLREIKNLVPLKERIHEDVTPDYILNSPDKEIIISDNNNFKENDPFKDFEFLLYSFFSNTLQKEIKGDKYIFDFELLHYNVKVIPDLKALKTYETGMMIGGVGAILWLVRTAILEILLLTKKEKDLDDITAMILTPLLVFIPAGEGLWLISGIIQDVCLLIGIPMALFGSFPRNITSILEANLKFYDIKGNFLFSKRIKGFYSERVNNVEEKLFKRRFLGLKVELDHSKINDLLKKARISFFKNL